MPEDDKNEILYEKSKTQFKREATALQKLGQQLTEMSEENLRQLSLPDELLDAILMAKKIHQRGGHKRQLQYIGKIMRKIDVELIEKSILNIRQQHKRETNRFHQLESWRDQLIENAPGILEELIGLFPDLDRQHLRQLVRNAQDEEKKQKPPKSSRAIFKYLQALDKA